MSFTKMADAADKDIAAGSAKEVILVNPDVFHEGTAVSFRRRSRRGNTKSG